MGVLATIAAILCIALSATPLTVDAEIYKYVLPDGRIVYSDKPEPGAEEVELEPLQTYTPAPIPAGGQGGAAAKPLIPTGYTRFEVTSPADDAVMRDAGGSVSISLGLEPALDAEHTIEIYINGAVVGSGKSTSLTLTNVDRGSHTVFAVVKAQGKELKRTPSITFHLKRGRI